MTDHLSTRRRSELMRRIRSQGTTPERATMRLTRALIGYFCRNAKSLPGRPDIASFSRRKAIFVHGCFWHQHANCKRSNVPQSNRDYWVPKLARNVARDKRNIRALQAKGWKTIVVWECECKQPKRLEDKLRRFLTASRYQPHR
jgi:DNA mismatch endonuclease, patch repair protein